MQFHPQFFKQSIMVCHVTGLLKMFVVRLVIACCSTGHSFIPFSSIWYQTPNYLIDCNSIDFFFANFKFRRKALLVSRKSIDEHSSSVEKCQSHLRSWSQLSLEIRDLNFATHCDLSVEITDPEKQLRP